LIENVPFSTFDLQKDGQSHTFSRSKYQKRAVGEKLKILSTNLASGLGCKSVGKTFTWLSANCILEITVKIMHFQGQNTIDV
jgi:hypothetical protein